MESLDKAIERFLHVSYGSGYGDGYGSGSGSGYGYGSGYGSGSGSGSGYGYGDGDGDGDGYGYGSDDGLVAFAGKKVYYVDNIPTIFHSVHRNYAKASIVKNDLTTEDCFIARVGDSFAHGKRLRDALRDATEKDMENRPVEERIRLFVEAHPDIGNEYGDLFSWHHILTGSCEFGRNAWCESHGLTPTDSITVRRFIDETKNDYGGEIIKQLEKAYL